MLSIIMVFAGAVMMNVGLRRIYQKQTLEVRQRAVNQLVKNHFAKIYLIRKVLIQKELGEEEWNEESLEEAEYLAENLVYEEGRLYSLLIQTT